MKKKIFLVSSLLFSLLLALLVNPVKQDNNSIFYRNLISLASANNEGGSSYMWSCADSYNACWFWDCSNIYRCGNPCEDASADDFELTGKCYKN